MEAMVKCQAAYSEDLGESDICRFVDDTWSSLWIHLMTVILWRLNQLLLKYCTSQYRPALKKYIGKIKQH